MRYTLVRTGEKVEVASRDFPTNKGGLCRKGWTAAELLSAPDRLLTPLLRRGSGNTLAPASWEEASTSSPRRCARCKPAMGETRYGGRDDAAGSEQPAGSPSSNGTE
jgi:predicted molibdopterin-dependent oxidoreductase YjgC